MGVALVEAEGGRCVEIRVDDTGAGVPEELRASIFDPFFTTKQRGTGLGLAVTREIVEAHHGTIHCEPRPERGTRFRIVLPVGDRAGQTGGTPSASALEEHHRRGHHHEPDQQEAEQHHHQRDAAPALLELAPARRRLRPPVGLASTPRARSAPAGTSPTRSRRRRAATTVPVAGPCGTARERGLHRRAEVVARRVRL